VGKKTLIIIVIVIISTNVTFLNQYLSMVYDNIIINPGGASGTGNSVGVVVNRSTISVDNQVIY
jgi:hypothetical protein